MENTEKKLTEKQEAFLDALFGTAKGNPVEAKKMAGYSDTTPTRLITQALADEIFEGTKKYLAGSAPRAAFALTEAIEAPHEIGLPNKITAAKDLLDRARITKKDEVEIKVNTPLFVLPRKE